MFQSFDAPTSPEQGPPRLAALRAELAKEGLDGFLVPRADAHQGEYVAPCDDRLAWLTGFSGSAGFCAALRDIAGVFVDGRYRVQVKDQTADVFTPVDWPEVKLGDWLVEQLPDGGTVALDPWLHTLGEIETLQTRLSGTGIALKETGNLVDRIWPDQPPRPAEPVTQFPKEFAGKGDETKRAEIAEALRAAAQRAAILTLPDSICWLLNIRGQDIPRNPITHAFAILHDDGRVELFSDPAKFAGLGPDPAITLRGWDAFEAALAGLTGPVRVDKDSAPLAVTRVLEQAEVAIVYDRDPCILPKACKTEAEINATRTAHLRDAAAMCEFLAWLDVEAPKGQLTEISVAQKLEGFRRATNALKDISFDTISAVGPNAALPHYRVSHASNLPVTTGELLLVDSGGQYQDGTTDITRTMAIGTPKPEHVQCFTRVLQGMIAISMLRWPRGLAGRDLDALARFPLWKAGLDYDHGTGHGVGVYLCVHEGPARLSKISQVPLEPGMILSNEPGYYREGAFGIRIENLIVVQEAPALPGGDPKREMFDFETITWVPIDRSLIDTGALSAEERAWVNDYHAEVKAKVSGRVSPETKAWLDRATAPI
ncbi:Xaa-Pro aminopeptidase [Candidatus Rhodobacter oscarellae]|uniref:Xaa-Pro aminopeptidase n=1 Tax=Candidatus Rhodobacter oscarellae TaxID=1675527 RepID=A0A0J9E6S9_9RHOB|nr:aminopeptidase P family protein [Candidatus Rhodobacter lobularis]KMW58480.1 Xaa-Pro aminopeptidase [Candidatus Rhodobacter lobularis]